jgi:hypothetical protein
MQKSLILLGILISLNLNAQTFLEIIPDYGFWNSDIANTKNNNDKAVIGKGLWKPSYGFSYVVNFGLPEDDLIYGVGFNFNTSTKGSISEIYSDCKIEMSAHSLGFFWQVNYKFWINTIFDFKMGFAVDALETASYQGNKPQSESFPRLNNVSSFKNSETLLIYTMGIKQQLFNEKVSLSLGITGDAGINKINIHQGSFKTQTLGIKIGLGIIILDHQDLLLSPDWE